MSAICTMGVRCVTRLPRRGACGARAAERTKADRLAAVANALDACGFNVSAERFRLDEAYASDLAELLPFARRQVQALRARLMDGSDERRYAATATALKALGELWAAS